MLQEIFQKVINHIASVILAVIALHLSLISTSMPPTANERETIDRAIRLLADRGFSEEVFLLNGTATFRASDHWLNRFVNEEEAYAATNFPFQIITLYADFYSRAVDDTERAMILLHEARHLMGDSEAEAYAFGWRHRHKLGYTLRSHSGSDTYATIESHTRSYAAELFNCPQKPWEDCTEP